MSAPTCKLQRNSAIVSLACDAYFRRKGMKVFSFTGDLVDNRDKPNDTDFEAQAIERGRVANERVKNSRTKAERIRAAISIKSLTREGSDGKIS